MIKETLAAELASKSGASFSDRCQAILTKHLRPNGKSKDKAAVEALYELCAEAGKLSLFNAAFDEITGAKMPRGADCGTCKGKGEVKCEQCGGHKEYECPECGSFVDCDECENGMLQCEDCDGRGWMEAK